MIRDVRMIKLSKLDTSRVKHTRELLDERLHAIHRRDGESACALSQLGISSGPKMEVIDRPTGWDGAS